MELKTEELETWDAKVFKSNTSSQIVVPMHIKSLYDVKNGDLIKVRFIKIIAKGEKNE